MAVLVKLFDIIRNNSEERAFARLYQQYYASLCRFALSLLNDRRLSEEVVDDAMFYLWDHRRDIEDKSIEGYLLRSVRNGCFNMLKSKSHSFASMTLQVPSAEIAEFMESLFDENHPLEQLLQKELAALTRKAIDNLPEECRRVFTMVRVDGMKYAEVAEELGISVNTVKYHMKNANKTLSAVLSNYIAIALMLMVKMSGKI